MTHRAIKRYDYHKWANRRIFDHLEKLPAEVYDREIESVFPSVSEVIAHIYQVDGMWLSVMSGDTFEETMKAIEDLHKESSEKKPDRMRTLYTELAGQYDSFLSGMENPDRILNIEHPSYEKLDVAVSDLVKHVVNHGTYHRGNMGLNK